MTEHEDPIEMPINGIIDLHTFRPQEAHAAVEAYIEACSEKGISELRIIHGKGKGVMRDQIHQLLSRHPDVISFTGAPQGAGSWGATLARIRQAPRTEKFHD